MEETRYIISNASKLVNVEEHTLRYWEDELELKIPRNELGHRYYREEDINLLKKIKELKDHGFQLKAIKLCIPEMDKLEKMDPASLLKLRDSMNDQEVQENSQKKDEDGTVAKVQSNAVSDTSASADRMGQFRTIMKEIISEVLKENNSELLGVLKENEMELSDTVSMNVTTRVIKEMNSVLRENEDREEERYRQLDRTIREVQSGKSHAAATKEKKKRRGLFGRHKSFA